MKIHPNVYFVSSVVVTGATMLLSGYFFYKGWQVARYNKVLP